MKIYISPVLII